MYRDEKEKLFAHLLLLVLFTLFVAVSHSAEITPFTPMGPYPSNGVQPGSPEFSWTAVGVTLSATVSVTGRELLLVNNADVTSATFLILSSTDEFGARGSIGGTVASASVCAFWFGDRRGWDSGSGVEIQCSSSSLNLAVARITQGFKTVNAATNSSRFAISNVRGPYPAAAQVTGGQLEILQNVAGYIAQATFPVTGSELLIWHNTDVTDQDFRLIGRPNQYQRTLYMPNSDSYTLGAGEWACWLISNPIGWVDSDGLMRAMGQGATLKLGIAKIPVR